MNLIERAIEELSSDKYCPYCLEAQGEKWHCCQENHFLSFNDLYKSDQEEMIDWTVSFYEKNGV